MLFGKFNYSVKTYVSVIFQYLIYKKYMNIRKTPIDCVGVVSTVNWNEVVAMYGITSTHWKLVGVC